MNILPQGWRAAACAGAIFLATAAHPQAPTISTVLGAGNGDGAQARHAQFDSVYGAVFDAAGNAYVVDSFADNVRKIAADGTISTVAGTSHLYSLGSCADGVAINLPIGFPESVALDHNGNPLILDTFDSCVRRLNSDGTLTTVAGGVYGFSGDNGPAVGAGLSSPSAIAVDASGNWYIADSNANRVRKVDTSGKITTIAGSAATTYGGDGGDATSAGVPYPTGVAVDPSGNVYIAEPNDYVVRKVDTLGKISTVAGNGTYGPPAADGTAATASPFENPHSVAVAADGELYIADTASTLVLRVDAQGKIRTVGGGSATAGYSADGTPALGAAIGELQNIAFDNSGRLMIMGGARVLRVETNATLTTFAGDAGYPDGTPAAASSLRFANNAAVDATGNLYVADTDNSRVRRLNRDGSVDTFAGDGSGNPDAGDGGLAKAAGLFQPSGVAVDAAGNVYIAEYQHVRKVDAATQHIAAFSQSGSGAYCGAHGRILSPAAMAFDRARGTLYVADVACDLIYAFDSAGNATAFAGTGLTGAGPDNVPATQSAIGSPSGVTVDAAGNVYIAEINNQRVRKVGLNGNIVTIAGTGTQGYNGDEIPALSAQLSGPDGVAVDPAGNVYISDLGNSIVRRVGTDGVIHRIAGSVSVQGYAGDGGLATSASLGGPQGLAYDRGTLYVVESFNSVVRAVDLGEIFANGFEP